MIKHLVFTIVAAVALILAVASSVAAVDVFEPCTQINQDSTICEAAQGSDQDRLFGPGGIWNSILNVFTYIIGAIAVLMIIIGGVRYILSGGDQNAVTGAKNTILYAVIGLVVAVLANAIVNFVLVNI